METLESLLRHVQRARHVVLLFGAGVWTPIVGELDMPRSRGRKGAMIQRGTPLRRQDRTQGIPDFLMKVGPF